MIEVFFCTMPLTEERQEISDRMLQWWGDQHVKLRVLTPKGIGSTEEEFNRKRRIYADTYAQEWAYILTDDDCELLSPKMIWAGIEDLSTYDEFGILSAMPQNATINYWTPKIYEPFNNHEIMEHVSVGGLRFVRAGCMTKGWPEAERKGYDQEHCQRLRECRWRSGYSLKAKMFHHGEGKSTLWDSVVHSKST